MAKTIQLVDKRDLVKISGGKFMIPDQILKPYPFPWPRPRPISPVKDVSIEDIMK